MNKKVIPKNSKEKAKNIAIKLKILFPRAKTELNYKTPLELVVAVILSAQTIDKQVNKVTEVLFKKYRSVDDYINTSLERFQSDIKNVGLYTGKAKNIKALMEILKEKYEGKIPNTMKDLVLMPGIGRKTANIILGNIYGIVEGIAVDTHVERLSQLFGLVKEKNAIKIEKELMRLLPKEEWFGFSSRLVLYGRYMCKASCKHEDCPLREYI